MTNRIISILLFLMLTLNLFFQVFASRHVHAQASHKSDQVQILTSDVSTTQSHQAQPNDGHCSKGICHSGFCKLVISSAYVQLTTYDSTNNYLLKALLFPESPFLNADRRPPKAIA